MVTKKNVFLKTVELWIEQLKNSILLLTNTWYTHTKIQCIT